ncbi:LOW QUALITY PROTEIN: hypothetical protein QYF61_024071, partial [Mycteria americana]
MFSFVEVVEPPSLKIVKTELDMAMSNTQVPDPTAVVTQQPEKEKSVIKSVILNETYIFNMTALKSTQSRIQNKENKACYRQDCSAAGCKIDRTILSVGQTYISKDEMKEATRTGVEEEQGGNIFNSIMLLRAPSNLTLNVSRHGASTTSLGNLFQCFTTLIVKNVFLISTLNLPSFSLKPLPLVLSQQALLKSLLPSFFSSCALAFLTPSLHNQAASLYSSQDTCLCFHCLCISFLPFSLTSRSRLIHASLLPSLPDLLHLELLCFMESIFKDLLVLFCSFVPEGSCPGFLLTNSLKSWHFAFLKFRVLTLLFALPISLRTANATDETNHPVETARADTLVTPTACRKDKAMGTHKHQQRLVQLGPHPRRQQLAHADKDYSIIYRPDERKGSLKFFLNTYLEAPGCQHSPLALGRQPHWLPTTPPA